MAEIIAGFGTAASVIAVIQISEQVITTCFQYVRTAKEAKSDIQSVINVVGGLKTTLENLKMLLGETMDDELPHLRSLDGPLATSCAALVSLARELGVDIEVDMDQQLFKFSFVKRLRWPWKEKEVDKVLGTIEKHKATLILAVAGDTLQTALITQADVGEVKVSLGELNGEVTEVKGYVCGIPKYLEEQRTKDIFRWLRAKTSDVQTNHLSAREKHEPTTGEWFIQSTEFTTWKLLPKSTLWLHGIPGAGKTVLCSTIIEHVSKLCGPEIQLTYFYFDFNDSHKEKVNGMLRSMIMQLCMTPGADKVPSIVENLFHQYDDGHKEPTLQSLIDTFSLLIATKPRTYVIIDALDECCERDKLIEIFVHIVPASQYLNLLVTSRREKDLIDGLESIMEVQIDLSKWTGSDADIRLHVQRSLDTNTRLRKWKPTIKEEIFDALVKGAKGMYDFLVGFGRLTFRFRWVECQLESLKRCLTPSAVRRTLSTLPKTMDDTYLRILKGIPGEYQKEVRCVLHLLFVSFRPLTLKEVAEALAVDYEAEVFDAENRLRDPRDILEMCSSLFSLHLRWSGFDISLESSLQFAHYSVQEYLVSNRIPSEFGVEKIEAHRLATKIGLTYLLSFDKVPRPAETDFPFLKYAATHWPDHALVLEDGHHPEIDLMLRLFARDPETINQDIIRSIHLF